MAAMLIDTTGLACPLPFFKLARALRNAPQGAHIDVLSTDPLAPGDFAELCLAKGHKILSSHVEGAVTRTVIQVWAAAVATPVDSGS
jgi:tRNA 2-thiouridine synthesizing protein A